MNTKPHVLVIDDDAVVGRSFDRVLTMQGYDVSTALSGEEALEKIGEEDFDVVFTDIKMPGMNGLDVAERIMDRCPWTPVVVITGYGTEDNEARARVLGTQGFVHKPLTPDIIKSVTLKAISEGRKPTRQPTEETVPLQAERAGALAKVGLFASNVGLFVAAPFIGLAYVIALPFVFFGMVAKLGYQSLGKRKASG